MSNDMISVIIPTFNGEAFLRECLQSISVQDVSHEVIVVDDVSTDQTVAIATEMGAKVIRNRFHRGQVAGKNIGIQNMQGQYFMTIDQDDRLKPNAMRNLLDELKKNHAEIIMAKIEDFAESEEDKDYCHPEPFWGILTGAALFKREVFNKIGLFDESVSTGEVIDLTDRCRKKNVDINNSEIITCERRIHKSNYGRTNPKDEYKDYAKLLRKQFLETVIHSK